ncbi:MAG: DUF86 domain-containing protein [Deltaproteobacteria bacterium]|nr:DUF86 domain-containing protein [Deltaproteobacteria bacterium]
MPRDHRLYLEATLEAIGKIRRYTGDLTLKTFAQDEKTLDAVVWNLEVIGEAMKIIPEEIRLAHPDVDWKKMAGLRDILIHEYFGVDVEIIWDIVQNKLPVLDGQLRRILAE